MTCTRRAMEEAENVPSQTHHRHVPGTHLLRQRNEVINDFNALTIPARAELKPIHLPEFKRSIIGRAPQHHAIGPGQMG